MESDTAISSLEQSLRSDTDSTSSKTPKFFSYIESHYGQLTRNHLKNWTSNNSGKKDFYNLKKNLKTEIRDIHIHIEFIKKSLERIKKQILDSNLDCNTVNQFFYLSNSKFNSILKKCNEKHQKKFDLLSTRKYRYRKTNKDSWFRNLSDLLIPSDVVDIVYL